MGMALSSAKPGPKRIVWQEFWDPDSEQDYYFNITTGKVMWRRPNEDFNPKVCFVGDLMVDVMVSVIQLQAIARYVSVQRCKDHKIRGWRHSDHPSGCWNGLQSAVAEPHPDGYDAILTLHARGNACRGFLVRRRQMRARLGLAPSISPKSLAMATKKATRGWEFKASALPLAGILTLLPAVVTAVCVFVNNRRLG